MPRSLTHTFARAVVTAVVTAVAVFIALPTAAAFADAAAPSDYQSRVVSITPATPALHARIIGGDSFIELRVDKGTAVDVAGYSSEPFIRYLADGTVQENRASASWYTSRSVLGSPLPPGFTADAPPAWHTVSTDGVYAWHDHRTHWMYNGRPPGKHPGDVVLEGTVPLTVNGTAVTVEVQSTWQPAPSRVPAAIGGLLGLAVALPLVRGRWAWWRLLPSAAVAALATVLGAWQFFGLPSETGPRPLWVVLPAGALAAAAAVWLLRRRGTSPALGADAALLLCGVYLVWWVWLRRNGLRRAVLPTHAPWWLDRLGSGAAITCGLVVGAVGLVALVRAIAAPGAASPVPS